MAVGSFGFYNYNNASFNWAKHNSPNQNGINMALLSKGRFLQSLGQDSDNYYGTSYTSAMQKQGIIGIPDENGRSGSYRIVPVDSDEGKARLQELKQEREAALAEVKKYDSFVSSKPMEEPKAPAETEEAAEKPDTSFIDSMMPKKDEDKSSWLHKAGMYTKNGTLNSNWSKILQAKEELLAKRAESSVNKKA